ncbi:MAG: septal ring lytic transglycosylase RlpA family protein [Leptolyngbyaceae cyanobacterium CSU_1_3]|nr:septal ring lytic transglycosylase RlpA family protein [Leptolyngbyaceae cyanobacterium CSU_1_3]
MNQKLISGLTATLLLTATFGTSQVGNAESTQAVSQSSDEDSHRRAASNPSQAMPSNGDVVKVGEQQTSPAQSSQAQSSQAQSPQTQGSQAQSSQTQSREETIAKIHSHSIAGKQAATLYVRNLPVLTFVGAASVPSNGIKMGAVQSSQGNQAAKLKSGSSQNNVGELASEQRQNSDMQTDPVTRATAIAAKLNQLYRDGVDASQITVSWKDTKNGNLQSRPAGRYVIQANKTTIVAVDASTILPDTTRDTEQDALQVTNRLRRIIGNASPLKEVENRPASKDQEISLGPIKVRVDGWASWYGPGFHGNASASGEIFNENAMTAAHRSLPFGTQVQVTNLDNGRSVIVRINDRGPFVGNRVIDLSAGAARILGVIHSGVAPVRLEVLDRRRRPAIASGN